MSSWIVGQHGYIPNCRSAILGEPGFSGVFSSCPWIEEGSSIAKSVGDLQLHPPHLFFLGNRRTHFIIRSSRSRSPKRATICYMWPFPPKELLLRVRWDNARKDRYFGHEIGNEVVLVGNSFGSLISLVSATKLRPKGCPGSRKDGEDAGFGSLELSCALLCDVSMSVTNCCLRKGWKKPRIVMLNCAVGMNNKNMRLSSRGKEGNMKWINDSKEAFDSKFSDLWCVL